MSGAQAIFQRTAESLTPKEGGGDFGLGQAAESFQEAELLTAKKQKEVVEALERATPGSTRKAALFQQLDDLGLGESFREDRKNDALFRKKLFEPDFIDSLRVDPSLGIDTISRQQGRAVKIAVDAGLDIESAIKFVNDLNDPVFRQASAARSQGALEGSQRRSIEASIKGTLEDANKFGFEIPPEKLKAINEMDAELKTGKPFDISNPKISVGVDALNELRAPINTQASINAAVERRSKVFTNVNDLISAFSRDNKKAIEIAIPATTLMSAAKDQRFGEIAKKGTFFNFLNAAIQQGGTFFKLSDKDYSLSAGMSRSLFTAARNIISSIRGDGPISTEQAKAIQLQGLLFYMPHRRELEKKLESSIKVAKELNATPAEIERLKSLLTGPSTSEIRETADVLIKELVDAGWLERGKKLLKVEEHKKRLKPEMNMTDELMGATKSVLSFMKTPNMQKKTIMDAVTVNGVRLRMPPDKLEELLKSTTLSDEDKDELRRELAPGAGRAPQSLELDELTISPDAPDVLDLPGAEVFPGALQRDGKTKDFIFFPKKKDK